MNKINLYNQSFKINGECFLTIIIERINAIIKI